VGDSAWSFGEDFEETPRGPAERRGLNEVGGYVLEKELARGGMGAVYRARHREFGRIVAIKLTLAAHSLTDRQRARFRREAEALARLDHPGIVKVHSFGDQAGAPYLVMDLVEGGSLSGLIKESGPLPPRRAAELMRQVAVAIHHGHERGVIHRDLKPSNVLLDSEGRARVTDFGLAAALTPEERLTQTGQFLGTLGYAPPEQIHFKRERLDARADVFSLGATLYALLTGEAPGYSIDSPYTAIHAILNGRVPPPSRANAAVDRRLDAVVRRCLRAEPEGRYATAAALAEDLRRYLAGESVAGSRTDLLFEFKRRRRALALGAACIPGLVFLAWAALSWTRGTSSPSPPRQPTPEVGDASTEGLAEAVTLALEHTGTHAQALELVGAPPPAAAEGLLVAPLRELAASFHASELELLLEHAPPESQAAVRSACQRAFQRSLQAPGADERRVVKERGAIQQELRRQGPWALFRNHLALAQRTIPKEDRLRAERVGAWLEAGWTPEDPAPFRAALAQLVRTDASPLAAAGWGRALARLDATRALPVLFRGVTLHGAVFARGVAQVVSHLALDPPPDAPARLGAARLLHLRRDPRTFELLSAVASDAPREAALLRCHFYLLEHDYARALKASAHTPADAELLGLRSRFLVRLRRSDEAARVAREALDLDPNEPAAWLGQAMVLMHKNEHQRAIQALTKASALDPFDPFPVFSRARAYKMLRRLGDAIRIHREAILLDPRWSAPYRNLGNLLSKRGRPDEALAAANLAVAIDPHDPFAWFYRGRVRERRREYDLVVPDVEHALKLWPRLGGAWGFLANVHRDRGDFIAAMRSADKALTLSPGDTHALRARAQILQRRGQMDEALVEWESLLKHSPGEVFALRGKAKILADRGQRAEALKILQRARALEPTSTAVVIDLARLRRGEGDVAGCLELLTLALKMEPEHGGAFVERAAAYSQLGEHDKAAAALDRAVQVEPTLPDIRLQRATHSLEHGRPLAAAEDAAWVLRRFPQRVTAVAIRGLAFVALKREDDARRDLLRYLKEAPQGAVRPQVLKALQDLDAN
jgi:tetratricopeptide (TPR) repeat protein